jgi:hypothetical protein
VVFDAAEEAVDVDDPTPSDSPTIGMPEGSAELAALMAASWDDHSTPAAAHGGGRLNVEHGDDVEARTEAAAAAASREGDVRGGEKDNKVGPR